MPTTVNGIGTHYYGKQNVSVRTAACAACHRIGALESYDTRLWFVIVFIPVIPLGRKRIIDQCPACSRHFAASADQYEQAKQLQTSGALERYQREPSPESALAVHGQLLAFRELDQASEFRAAALQRFPRHAGLRVGLAQQLQQVTAFAEADALFREAYEIAPGDLGARTGVAYRKMDEGDLDGARGLLDFLEQPGAGQQHNLGPLDVLAGYYQRAGRHEEAVALAEVLLREWPPLGGRYPFRTFVRKSEKALGRAESILPPRPMSLLALFRAKDSPYAPWQRYAAIGTLVVVLLAAGLALNNEYIRRHRTLHVVNACGAPVQVQVDDGPAVAVDGLGKLTVAEGAHTIRVTGPVDETHQVEIAAGYLDRWFKSPVWVLNPGGEAVLQETRIVYSQNPRPSHERVIVGQPFFAASNFDYVFESAPKQMSVRDKTAEVVKTELTWVRGHDVEAFHAALPHGRPAALDFAEQRLKRDPRQGALLKAYLSRVNAEEMPRVRALLRSGLDVRPVIVPWHRAYQSVAEEHSPEAELLALYDRFLAAEPTSAALLYLRGRIEPDEDQRTAYYRRAADADDKLAWPWIGLAAQAAGWGRWPEALEAARKAKERTAEDTELLDDVTHAARLGAGQAEELVQEYRARLEANTLTPVGLVYLGDALVTAGKAGEVEAAVAAWEGRLPAEVRAQVGPHLRAHALYQAGKLQECADLCAQTPALHAAPARADALMALGKGRQAADDPALAQVWNDAWDALALSVAFDLDGQAEDAARWRDRAKAKTRHPRVAEAIDAARPPTLASLACLPLRTPEKALLLTMLAARFPEKRDEYLRHAAVLNVRRSPPYLIVRRAVESKFDPHP
jgi:tetratricopeptide (TPR) repeat protein